MNILTIKSLLVTGLVGLAGGTTTLAMQNNTAAIAPTTIAQVASTDDIAGPNRPGQPNPLGLSQEARDFLRGKMEEATAATLGLSVEELQAARQDGQRLPELLDAAGLTPEQFQAALDEAFSAAVQEAEAAGLITADQAAQLQEAGFHPRGGHGGPRGNGQGQQGGPRGQDGQGGPDGAGALLPAGTFKQITADALGITVDELETARTNGQHLPELAAELGLDMPTVQATIQSGVQTALAQAVADGTITQAQADEAIARMALREIGRTLHQEAVSSVLGISTADLQAYHEAGTRLPEIIAELGLDAESVRSAMPAAWETTLQQAVTDGRITAEQATQLQQMPAGGRGGQQGGPAGQGGRGGQNAPAGPANNG